jgi:hypothetical protein
MSRTAKWTVTRQCQWPTGDNIVEVSQGGIDYSNPDALCKKYQGEFEEFTDPREAAVTAIAICKAWRIDVKGKDKQRPQVAHGATGGMTMPFEGCTFKSLLAWGNANYEALPRCCECGDLLGAERYNYYPGEDSEDCCSEYCAEKRYAANHEEEVA